MSEYPETADGTLVIMVCRAKHLPNRRKLDKQSPYVLLRLNTVAKKTPSQFRAGQTPEWTHEIRFQLSRDRKPLMKVDVLDETKSDPTPIGSTEIDCSLVFSDQANLHESGKYILDGWYDLSFNTRFAGKVYLEMTFYPSVPVVPPKLSLPSTANKLLPTPPPLQHEEILDEFTRSAPETRTGPDSDLFVSGSPKKKHFFRLSNPEPQPESSVFTESSSKQKNSRFAKLKDRLMAKEPITAIFSESRSEQPPKTDTFSRLDVDLDQLQNDIGLGQYIPSDLVHPHEAQLPPPPPPHKPQHQENSPQRQSRENLNYMHNSNSGPIPTRKSPSPDHFDTRCGSYTSPSRSPRRKPPPAPVEKDRTLTSNSTKIPFSADSFQLDDTEAEALPTKVYHLEQQVKSLTVQNSGHTAHRIDSDEIDPRFYAPTPSEHLAKTFRLQGGNVLPSDVEVDFNTRNSGYLGEGRWQMGKEKFSPSVFQRIRENDENSGEGNKPPVPPKIPSGLTAKEYYILEKDKFLKDVNGRRL